MHPVIALPVALAILAAASGAPVGAVSAGNGSYSTTRPAPCQPLPATV